MFRKDRASAFLWTVSLTVIACSFFWISSAHAADRFWVGAANVGDSDRWENPDNWSAFPKGLGPAPDAAGIPGASDVAIFNYSGSTVQIRSEVVVGGIELNSVWTGSVLQGTGTITVGSSDFRVGSGRFIGGDASINLGSTSGPYIQTGGIVSGIQNNFALSGSFLILDGGGATPSFTSTGTIIFNGNADQSFSLGTGGTVSLTNLTVSNAGGGSVDDIIFNSSGGGLNLSGALSIEEGNLDLTTNSQAMVVEGGITLADDTDAELTTNSSVTASGTILVNNSATITVTGGTWTLNDDGDQSVDLDGQRLFGLTLNNTGGDTNDDVAIAGGGLQLSGALTITLGNLDLTTNSQTMIVEGGITLADAAQATLATDSNVTASGTILVNDSATITITGGTWTLNDDGNQSADFDGQALNNLTLNLPTSGSDRVTVTGTLDVNGNLTITQGELFLDTNSLDLEGNLTIADDTDATLMGSGSINIAGNFTKNNAAGTTLTGSTVTLDGTSQTLSGSISFYNLTKTVTTPRTLTFAANTTQRITNALTLKFEGGGGGSNVLSLRSSQGGTQWIINPQGTRDVSWLDVADSNNTSGTISCSTCSDSGNNTGWSFEYVGEEDTTTTTTGGGGGGGGRRGSRSVGSTYAFVPGAAEAVAEAVEEEVAEGPLPSVRGKLEVTVENQPLVLKDILVGEWFAPYVARLVSAGIVSGYRDARGRLTGEFGPANNVTYAEIAKMAVEAAGLEPLVGVTPANRSARGEWSEAYIATLESLGASILSDPGLDIDDPAPRGAVVQTILEVFGVVPGEATGDLYSDISAGARHAAAIEMATIDEIVSGDDDATTFRPRAPINRAETAKVIDRAMSVYGEE